MFTILIAEDEQAIKEEIVMGVKWNNLQIDKIIQASNGEEAFSYASKNKIDILLTDIRMPRSNGIELSRKVRKIYPDCIIIFLSAYSDKEYLMSAIKLRCNNYVEKPLQIELLNNTLKEAISSYQEIENKKFKDIMLQDKFKESIPLILNEIAIQVTNRNADWDMLIRYTSNELLNIDVNASYISVIIRLIRFSNQAEKRKAETLALMRSFYEFLLSKGLNCFYGSKDEENFVFHISSKSDNCYSLNQMITKQLLMEWQKAIGYKRIFCSVGTHVKNLRSIPESYSCAKQALNKCFFRGYGSIVCYKTEITKATLADSKFIDCFSDALENHDNDAICSMLKNFCDELEKYENIDIEEIRFFFTNLVIKIVNRLQLLGSCDDTSSSICRSYLDKIQSSPTLRELRDCLLDLVTMYFGKYNKFNNNNSIKTVICYIEKYYKENSLDINRISKNTFLSPAYLCTYFKRETGKTINQYITDYRLNKAIEFLKNSEFRIADVAAKVGYDDGNYFTRIFKKKYGLSPSEYRERLGF